MYTMFLRYKVIIYDMPDDSPVSLKRIAVAGLTCGELSTFGITFVANFQVWPTM